MEVSGRTADEMSASTTEASQEKFEVSCDPCSTDGQELSAKGFCVDCQHYLCETCYKYHCRPMPMRSHVLLSKSEMPRQKMPAKPKDVCTEKCLQHKSKSIKYYCKTDDQLGCSVCMTTNHRGCDDVSYIEDIAEGIEDSAEYKDLLLKFQATEKRFHDNKCKTEQNISRTKACFSRAIEDIGKLRNKVNNMFDKLENEVKKKAKCNEDNDIERMTTVNAACSKAIQEIQTLASELEILRNSQESIQLFIKMKKAEKNMTTLEDDIHKVKNEDQTGRYKFVPDPQIQDLLRSINEFGRLKDSKDLKATHIQDINVKTSSDKEKCLISGSTMLSDGRLIITDIKNMSVKLLDTKQNKITAQLKMTSRPMDITEIKLGEVAVTAPNKIQFVTVSDTLSKDRELKVDGACQGLVCYGERLAVTFKSPPKVEIMKIDGTVLNVISTDMNGGQLFNWPRRIAVSPDQTTLYVSDFYNDSLTSMTMKGLFRAVYKDKDLKRPIGICVDSVGTVYMCGCDSHTVHQITKNGERLQILLKQADGVTEPYSITYSDQEDKLYLGFQNDHMMVFEFK